MDKGEYSSTTSATLDRSVGDSSGTVLQLRIALNIIIYRLANLLVSERETIPPSETGSARLFKEITIPETYRRRGSAVAA
jgi:hypothetical protein